MESKETLRRVKWHCWFMGVSPPGLKSKFELPLTISILRYGGPQDGNYPTYLPREVVVKETFLEGHVLHGDLEEEHEMTSRMLKAESSHIVRLFKASNTLGGNDPIAVRQPDLAGKICRLYLEYCPHGDLKDLIRFRQSEQVYAVIHWTID